ncbi:MAG: FtsQ-type POTRA domain-containing protein [Pyrinomonadaceae bacterium]|nr:FtsQ-type POTRA domain-containing protein [Pyrinomonadaceae bacterium]
MREQIIAHRVGNRSGGANARRSGAAAQRPLRRDRAGDGDRIATRLRALVGYLPSFLKLVLAIVAGLLVFAGYRAAASASFFKVRNVEVQGTSRVSATEVQALVRRDVEKTGVWKADLAGVSARLERLPWVRSVVVSRVLPDGIRVRISERVPRAVVRTASGRFRWVDEDAVLLGEMLPTDQIPSFFLRGLNEEDAAATRGENRERVQKFMELQRDWDAAGLSERVSEVNLIDIHDIRAQLAGDNSQIEVRLGSQDQGNRLRKALEVLDGQRQMSHGGLISYIDLSQGRRAIVGLVTGAQATATNSAEPEALAVEPAPKSVAEKKPDREKTLSAVRDARVASAATTTASSKAKKERDAKQRSLEKKSDKTLKTARRN